MAWSNVIKIASEPRLGADWGSNRKPIHSRLRELEIAEREGVLIPVDDVVKWAGENYGVVRSRLFAMESQMADLTDNQRQTFRALLNDALSEITVYRVEEKVTDDEADEDPQLEDMGAPG
jgi:hypothetical protein